MGREARGRRRRRERLLSALAALLLAAVASPCVSASPPAPLGAPTFETRELRVGSLRRDGSVAWDEYRLLRLEVVFDQPLFKAAFAGGAAVHTRYNSSGVDASLDGALELRCAGAAAPFVLRSAAAAEGAWSRPGWDLFPERTPAGGPGAMGDAMLLFEPADAPTPRASRNRVSVLAVTAFRPNDGGGAEVLLLPAATDVARDCRLAYVPLGARPGADAQPPSEPATADAAEAALDRLPSMLASVRGEEAVLDAELAERAGREGCARRTLLRLSGEPAWEEEARHPGAEAARPVFERAALLESRHEVGMPLGKMFKPVVAGVLEPIVEIAVKLCNAAMINVFVQQASHTIVKEVAPDVSLMLSDRLLANLTNILTDSVSYTMSRSLSVALTRVLDPYLTWSLAEKLVPELHVILKDALEDKIPSGMDDFMPELLNRVLPLTLTHSLTRSVPHVVVASLTHTLTHSRHADKFCNKCYYEQTHCSLCHFSRESMYYQIYHATYYTDYYANYYATYYADALKLLDAELYPETAGTAPPGDAAASL